MDLLESILRRAMILGTPLLLGTIGEIIVENGGDIRKFEIADTICITRQNEICIYSDNYDILIYFNVINDVLSSDIQGCVNKVIDWEAKHLSEEGSCSSLLRCAVFLGIET